MGRVESGGDLVAVAVCCPEGIGQTVQVEPVAEEMFQHGHTVGATALKHNDGDTGGRHPGNESFKVCEPFFGWDVIRVWEQRTKSPLSSGLADKIDVPISSAFGTVRWSLASR
jgi:hypothetical protein